MRVFYDEQLAAAVRDEFSYNPANGRLYRRRLLTTTGYLLKQDVGRPDGRGYLRFHWYGKNWFMHRLVWVWFHGYLPDEMEIHHVNRNRADNRIQNLELLTRKEHIRAHNKKVDMW